MTLCPLACVILASPALLSATVVFANQTLLHTQQAHNQALLSQLIPNPTNAR
ncbi:hypothetical protein [Moraxella marmotae]|uniref:hypothetical protein n=1 Tax=Moraxella marmotae TaxID=3344520 RepID=UPI0035F250BC